MQKFVTKNQTGPFKPKRTITVKEMVTKGNIENIIIEDETNISFQPDNISLGKTLSNSSIICGSVN